MALFGRPSAQDEARALAYRQWLLRRNPLAIASLVLGVFSLIEFGALLIFGIAGILLGVAALAQLRRLRQTLAHARPGDGAGGNVGAGAEISEVAAIGDDAPGGDSPPRVHGDRLAWAGIALSAASLVIAALLYLRVFG